ncbi:MAG: hypothetical protein ACI8XO_003801 [Verrucomicrobiales bacterium]|jgi:hypothetical protein
MCEPWYLFRGLLMLGCLVFDEGDGNVADVVFQAGAEGAQEQRGSEACSRRLDFKGEKNKELGKTDSLMVREVIALGF